tara:strand:+ start:93 stop:245 length:153 start_codon:yes stop_codon:yes gene_type:complete
MKEKIEEKLEFYEKSLSDKVASFIGSMKRVDRDRVIRTQERIAAYKELLK